MSIPIVAELGSFSTRLGHAGDDRPATVLPSCYGTGGGDGGGGGSASSGSPSRYFCSPARQRSSPSKRQRLGSHSASRPRPDLRDYTFGSEGLLSFKEGSAPAAPGRSASVHKIHSLIEKGQVQDWGAVEALWQSVLSRSPDNRGNGGGGSSGDVGLSISPVRSKNTLLTQGGSFSAVPTPTASDISPVLLVEPMRHPRVEQQKMCELLFETFQVPAISAIKSASAGVFANGRTTGLALDMGHAWTTAVPVKDGFSDETRLFATELGGAVLTEAALEILRAQLRSTSTTTNPLDIERHIASLSSSSNQAHSSQVLYKCRDVARRWKQQFCFIAPSAGVAYEKSAASATFDLPDGTEVVVQPSTWGAAVGDLLFDPSVENLTRTVADSVGVDAWTDSGKLASISRMDSIGKVLFQSLSHLTTDMRHTMLENLVLFGGSSVIPGMSTRLKNELAPLLPARAVVKIIETRPADRVMSSWIGGSLIGALPAFTSSMCVSKQKYDEDGVDRVNLLQEHFQ
jgi:actin, other eukaryote